MRRTQGLRLSRAGIFAGLILVALSNPNPALAGMTVVSFTNNTGSTVTSLQADFLVSANTITSVDFLSNAPGAGTVTISPSDASVPPFTVTGFNLTWATPGLPSGGTVEFEFGPVTNLTTLITGTSFGPTWTLATGATVPVDLTRDDFTSNYVPEPGGAVLLGTGAIAALAAGVRRRRVTGR